jgi:hypothetical protein
MKRIVIAMLLCVGVVGAQQAGSLVWNPNGSSITVTGPAVPATLNFTLPAKNGTLALLSDISVTPPSIVSGSVTLTNGAGSTTIPSTVTRCVVSDASGNSVKYAKGATTLTVQGVGPIIDYACF